MEINLFINYGIIRFHNSFKYSSIINSFDLFNIVVLFVTVIYYLIILVFLRWFIYLAHMVLLFNIIYFSNMVLLAVMIHSIFSYILYYLLFRRVINHIMCMIENLFPEYLILDIPN